MKACRQRALHAALCLLAVCLSIQGMRPNGGLFDRLDGSAEAVLWTSGQQGVVTIPPRGTTTVRVDDMMDDPVATTGAGALGVPVSADPVFLSVRGASAAELTHALRMHPRALAKHGTMVYTRPRATLLYIPASWLRCEGGACSTSKRCSACRLARG